MGVCVGVFIEYFENESGGYMQALWTLLGALIIGTAFVSFGSYMLKMPELKWSIGRRI